MNCVRYHINSGFGVNYVCRSEMDGVSTGGEKANDKIQHTTNAKERKELEKMLDVT